MSIIFAEGWDTAPAGDLRSWAVARGIIDTGISGLSREDARLGTGYSVRVSMNSNNGLIVYAGAGLTEGAYGGAFRHGGFAYDTSYRMFRASFASGANLDLTFNGDLYAQISLSGAGAFTQSFYVPSGTAAFNFYEVRWSSTVIEVALNNQIVYTHPTGIASLATEVRLASKSGTIFDSMVVDECYVADDATFYNDMYIKPATLLSTETNTGTVYGALSAHAALASVDGDTSYVNFNAVGQKVVCELSNIVDTNPAAIHGIVLTRQARKDETGSVTERFLIKRGSTEYEVGPSFTGLALQHTGRRIFVPTDPSTSASWTKSGTEDARAGIKRV